MPGRPRQLRATSRTCSRSQRFAGAGVRQLVPELVVGERRKGHRAAHDAHRQRIDVARAEQAPVVSTSRLPATISGKRLKCALARQRRRRPSARCSSITPGVLPCRAWARHAGTRGSARASRHAPSCGAAGWSAATRQTISSDISRPRCSSPGGSSQLPITRSTCRLRQAAPVVEGARQRQQLEARLRRLALEMRHQLGQEERVEVVARGDAEGQRRLGGREPRCAGPGAEQPVGVLQQAAGRLQQLQAVSVGVMPLPSAPAADRR